MRRYVRELVSARCWTRLGEDSAKLDADRHVHRATSMAFIPFENFTHSAVGSSRYVFSPAGRKKKRCCQEKEKKERRRRRRPEAGKRWEGKRKEQGGRRKV